MRLTIVLQKVGFYFHGYSFMIVQGELSFLWPGSLDSGVHDYVSLAFRQDRCFARHLFTFLH